MILLPLVTGVSLCMVLLRELFPSGARDIHVILQHLESIEARDAVMTDRLQGICEVLGGVVEGGSLDGSVDEEPAAGLVSNSPFRALYGKIHVIKAQGRAMERAVNALNNASRGETALEASYVPPPDVPSVRLTAR